MPPQAKITKEMILNAALAITMESGFDAVNARSIASQLHCSTRPIFTCYENMEALKAEFLIFAYEAYEQYVAAHPAALHPLLTLPLSYIAFAQEEPNLFSLLFINDMALAMAGPTDFYAEKGNEHKAKLFSQELGIPLQQAKAIFLDLFLYTHGIAVLAATKKLTLSQADAENMVANLLTALIRQEKPGWQLPVLSD